MVCLCRAALLFYRKMRKDLEHTYGIPSQILHMTPCVANWNKNRSQCTIVWHVDDLKVSHKDEDVVAYFIQKP